MYEKFAKLCENKGVTPYKVAKSTGIASSTLSEWKKGKSTPKTDKLQKIADYFNVDINYLLCDQGEEKIYYFDGNTQEIAQEIFENKDLRLLFDAGKDASAEDLKLVTDMLLNLKNRGK